MRPAGVSGLLKPSVEHSPAVVGGSPVLACGASLTLDDVLKLVSQRNLLAEVCRKVPRHEFRHVVSVLRQAGRDGRAVSYDISPVGMGLFTPFLCHVGELIHVRLTMRDHGMLEQSAIVTRVCDLAHGIWETACLFRSWDE